MPIPPAATTATENERTDILDAIEGQSATGTEIGVPRAEMPGAMKTIDPTGETEKVSMIVAVVAGAEIDETMVLPDKRVAEAHLLQSHENPPRT